MAKQSHNSTTTQPGFKLTRHVKGWVAKIGGKVRWLAPLDKPQLALERYHQKMRAYQDGRDSPPPVANNSYTLGALGELFVDAKFAKVQAGELKIRTYDGYERGVFKAVEHFGYGTVALNIAASGWQGYRNKLAAECDVHSVARHVGAIRALSKWALLNEHIDRPFRFGTEFNLPSQKAMRAAKEQAGDRTYSADQVKTILEHAEPVLKAMFLLSINGGVGNTDIAKLRDANVKADRIEFKRSKTDVPRVVPLWPETIQAIKEARAMRPAASTPDLEDRVFLTERGLPYVRDNVDGEGNLTSTTDKIATLFWKGMKTLGITRSFYDGRRTFQTLGDRKGPPHVVRAIMGHSARGDDMSDRYRQNIPEQQLWDVVNHVRELLGVGAKRSVSGSAKASKGAARSKGRRAATPGKPQRRKGGTAK